MKIVHFISSLGKGGAERQIALLTTSLVAGGDEVHVAYLSGGPNLELMKQGGVHLHHIPSSGNHDWAVLWRLSTLIHQLKPDVIQTWLLQMDVMAGIAALFRRTPLVITERSSSDLYPPSLKSRLRVAIGKRARCVVANSEGGRDYWRQHVPEHRLRLIRNCISPPSSTQPGATDPALHVQGDHRLVIFAGRFSQEKNISRLTDALIGTVQKLNGVKVVMFGDGPEIDSVRRTISAADADDRITLPGYSSHLSKWMQRADLLVAVSLFEGHPNVVMEAAAAGCPLVLSDIPAHREIFDEKSANFTPAYSSIKIEEAIIIALSEKEKTKAKAKAAQNICKAFSVEEMRKSYQKLYLEIRRH